VLGVPDERAWEEIFCVMTQNMRASSNLNYMVLAVKTQGFVGADMCSLLKEVAVITNNRTRSNVR
jgi:ribosome biogenesis ATPase